MNQYCSRMIGTLIWMVKKLDQSMQLHYKVAVEQVEQLLVKSVVPENTSCRLFYLLLVKSAGPRPQNTQRKYNCTKHMPIILFQILKTYFSFER